MENIINGLYLKFCIITKSILNISKSLIISELPIFLIIAFDKVVIMYIVNRLYRYSDIAVTNPFDEMRSRCRAALMAHDIKLTLSMITSIPLRHSFLTWRPKESSRKPVS